MTKLSLTCDELPQDLPDAQYLAAWREQFQQRFGELGADIEARCDLPGKSGVAVTPLRGLSIMALAGNFDQMKRRRISAAGEDAEELAIAVNRGVQTIRFHRAGGEVGVAPGQATLFAEGMSGRFECAAPIEVAIFRLPRASLLAKLRAPGDLATRALEPNSEPVRMLDAYARAVMAIDGVNDISTSASVSAHMLELVALAVASAPESRELSGRGALRRGRIQTLLGEIEASFLDPDFTLQQLAGRQRVTPRYLQELLAETGVSFGDRVLDLRLSHARSLLERAEMAHRKVIDIAFSCGFNDLSYFHRCFRKRFGMTPGDARYAVKRDPDIEPAEVSAPDRS